MNDFIKNKHSDFEFLIKMFQVRHIYEHNMGVIDDDFVQRLPNFSSNMGRKYALTQTEIEKYLVKMKELDDIMKEHFKN